MPSSRKRISNYKAGGAFDESTVGTMLTSPSDPPIPTPASSSNSLKKLLAKFKAHLKLRRSKASANDLEEDEVILTPVSTSVEDDDLLVVSAVSVETATSSTNPVASSFTVSLTSSMESVASKCLGEDT